VRAPSFVLVHSPVAGPSTWRWVAEMLAARGHRVMVPVVPGAITSLGWERFADSVAAQTGQEDHAVLVGHSGAGPLLPQIRARARWEPGALIFVDAALPPDAGDAELVPSGFLADLRAMAREGLLPAFSDWFGPDVMKELIPDDEKRAAVCGELPRLPVSFFESRVPAPQEWASAGCGCVQLSQSYADEAAAASRGWPVLQRPGAHVDTVTRPAVVTDAILSVTRHGHPDHCADLNPLLRARALRDDPPAPLPVCALPGALDAVLALDRPGMLAGACALHEFSAGASLDIGPFQAATCLLPHSLPNAGVRLAAGGRVLTYTGDSGPSMQVVGLARGADLLVAEASYVDQVPANSQLCLSSARHAGRQAQAGVGRLMLTHLLPGTDHQAALAAARTEYHGDISVATAGLVLDLQLDTSGRPERQAARRVVR
jgi:ribonuclease BN (tRNA processing enzyme)